MRSFISISLSNLRRLASSLFHRDTLKINVYHIDFSHLKGQNNTFKSTYTKMHEPVTFGLRILTSAILDQWVMAFGIDNTLGQIWSISMSMHFCFQNLFHKVQDIGLFQNKDLAKASTNDTIHMAMHWARNCQHQYVCQILSNHSAWLQK